MRQKSTAHVKMLKKLFPRMNVDKEERELFDGYDKLVMARYFI